MTSHGAASGGNCAVRETGGTSRYFFHCCSMAIGSFLGEELDQFRAGLGGSPACACVPDEAPPDWLGAS
jgi:hypothetical protein